MTQPGEEPCMENRSRMFFQLEAQTKGFVINASLGPGSAPAAAPPDFSPWRCQDGGQGAEQSQALVCHGAGPSAAASLFAFSCKICP